MSEAGGAGPRKADWQMNGERRSGKRPIMAGSMTRTIVFKPASRSHGAEGPTAGHNFLIQRIVLERIGSNVVHVFPRRQHFVAQALHVVEHIVQQLKTLSIIIG